MLAKNPDQPTQLLLSFPPRTALGREDFLLGSSNREAFALVDDWPQWSDPVNLIVGPKGSGKTHLVEIWAAASDALVARDRFLVSEVLRSMDEGRPVALELGDARHFDERAVFHVLNAARQAGSPLLLTARDDWQHWNLTLPDAISRVRAISPVILGPPDDDLLKQVVVKLFSDRQTGIGMAVLDFALVRLERSFEAAILFVDACDEIALRSARKVSKQVATDALLAVERRLREQ